MWTQPIAWMQDWWRARQAEADWHQAKRLYQRLATAPAATPVRVLMVSPVWFAAHHRQQAQAYRTWAAWLQRQARARQAVADWRSVEAGTQAWPGQVVVLARAFHDDDALWLVAQAHVRRQYACWAAQLRWRLVAVASGGPASSMRPGTRCGPGCG